MIEDAEKWRRAKIAANEKRQRDADRWKMIVEGVPAKEQTLEERFSPNRPQKIASNDE